MCVDVGKVYICVFDVGKEYVCVVRLHNAIASETKLAQVSSGWNNGCGLQQLVCIERFNLVISV